MSLTKGRETNEKKGISQFIGYGIKNLKLNKIEFKLSSKDTVQFTLHVETRKVTVPDFEPHQDSTNGGQIGKVKFPNFWLSTPEQYSEFLDRLCIIADKLDVRAKFDSLGEGMESLNRDNIEAYMQKAEKLFTNKYAYWKISGKEYLKQDQKSTGMALNLAWYGFIASEAEGESHLKFDPSKHYDLSKLQVADSTDLDAKVSDDSSLPF